MAFHELSYHKRYALMGAPAEGTFEAVAPLGKFERFGWDKPAVSLTRMTAMLRHLPDYYSGGFLVEAVGLGKDGQLKLKVGKMQALKKWNDIQPVSFFVWNSHHKRWLLIEWDAMAAVFNDARKRYGLHKFHDGPSYVAIPWASLVKAATKEGTYEPDSE